MVCVHVCVLSTDLYSPNKGDQIRKKEMSGKCNNTYAGRERCLQAVVERTEGKKKLKDLGVDGSIILKLMFMNRNGV